MPAFPVDLCKDEEKEDFILVSSSGVPEDRDTSGCRTSLARTSAVGVPCPKAYYGTDILMRQEGQLGKSESPPKAADSSE